MPLNFHRIPASGEYRLKANKRRIHSAAFHSFVAPLSATLWIILWIVPPAYPFWLALASSASPVVNLSINGGKKGVNNARVAADRSSSASNSFDLNEFWALPHLQAEPVGRLASSNCTHYCGTISANAHSIRFTSSRITRIAC